MEGLKIKREYTSFELSCCLEEMVEQYERMSKGQNIKLDSNESEQDWKEKAEMLRQLQGVVEERNEQSPCLLTEEKECQMHATMLDVIEMERKRIARDLHDSSVQLLTMLVHKAELCEKLIDQDLMRTKTELSLMGGYLKDTISELRQTIFDLRPMTIEDLGLMDSIERYLQMAIQSSEIQFRIKSQASKQVEIEERLNPTQKLALYRIVQECCSNIIKHSGATKALVSLGVKDNKIYLQIDDNGIGFAQKEIPIRMNGFSKKTKQEQRECLNKLASILGHHKDLSGYGMSMLLERIYLMNGTIMVATDEKGTSISIEIPITTKEEIKNETNKDNYCR